MELEIVERGPFEVRQGVEFPQLVLCPDGHLVMSGGFRSNRYVDVRVSSPFSNPPQQSGWSFVVRNPVSQPASVTLYAICLKQA